MKKVKNRSIKFFLVFLVVILSFPNIGQAQCNKWPWAYSPYSITENQGLSITTDYNDNIYVTGFFKGGVLTFDTFNLINNNCCVTGDMFIVKYDSSGNILWADNAGGMNEDIGRAVTTDNNGNVYVVGDFQSYDLIFGDDTLINTGWRNAFLVKYDSIGNKTWARNFGGFQSFDSGHGVTTDNLNNVYITGAFTCDTIIIGVDTLINSGNDNGDIYIIKYDSNGNTIWARKANGSLNDFANSITADINGNIYLTGKFHSSNITFGSIELNNTGSGGFPDMFLVKYNTNGNAIWAFGSNSGTSSSENGISITLDNTGNILLTGSYENTAVTFGSFTLLNNGQKDIFVLKCDTAGTILWAKAAGGIVDEEGKSIISDIENSAIITGYYYSDTLFIDSSFISKGGNSSKKYLLVKYDSLGNLLCAKTSDVNNSIDAGAGITTDSQGNIILTGHFPNDNLRPLTFDTIQLYCQMQNDMFIAKQLFTPSCITPTAGFTYNINEFFVSFFDSSNNTIAWDWDFGDGITDTIQNPTHYYSDTGTYIVCLSVLNNCGNDSSCKILNIPGSTTSVIDNVIQNHLIIYPNPAKNKLSFLSSIILPTEILIYNNIGKIVFREAQYFSIEKNNSIDVTQLTTGIYLLQIRYGTKDIFRKLIIIK